MDVGLTSHLLLVIAVLFAIAFPIALVVFVWVGLRSHSRRLAITSGALVACLLAQVAGIAAVFLKVNDEYVFYSSFGDLLGQAQTAGEITSGLPSSPGSGRVELINVHGKVSKTNAQVLVWLPRQYNDPAYKHTRFPVLEFLPGQPNAPAATFERFNVAQKASQLIDSGQIKPFVVVVPPLMIRPPYDTECTNVPHGPRAYDWLSKDVTAGVMHKLRVQPPGKHWSLMGWSTGGFCAAKMLLTSPNLFGSAVSLGGYYTPTLKGVYPHLLGSGKNARHVNSPTWLLVHRGMTQGHILVVVGRQDPESWGSTERFVRMARYFPGVAHTIFPTGGHNVTDYGAYLDSSLTWLKTVGSL